MTAPTVGEIVRKTTEFFKGRGFESARLDSELLISRALGWDRLQVFLKIDYPLTDAELERCRELVKRRGKGEPVAYITGEKGFYNSTFEVSPATLIPRPETELLVDRAVALLAGEMSGEYDPEAKPESANGSTGGLIVDLGCGTGCIGLSVANEAAGDVSLLLVDQSEEAVAIARRNAERLGLAEQTDCLVADAGSDPFSEWAGQAILVVANPPYIEEGDTRVDPMVRQFEPAAALFADDNGLHEIKRWSKSAQLLLRSGGTALFEIGDGQGAAVVAYFKNTGWNQVALARDLAGRERMIEAKKR